VVVALTRRLAVDLGRCASALWPLASGPRSGASRRIRVQSQTSTSRSPA